MHTMRKNLILTTIFTLCLLTLNSLKSQNAVQPEILMNPMQLQLDETCNVVTTSIGANVYIFTIMPVDETPNCTHYFKYFIYNPKTDTWHNFQNDSLSIPSYVKQVKFSKDIKYRVQHYIVSNDKSHQRSPIFEVDFILKKPLKAKNTEEDILVMLSQKNIGEIASSSNIDTEAAADLQSATTQKTSKFE